VLRLIPPLVVDAAEVDTGLSMLDDALAKATAG
jgi:4-aminobutyrate aminotransferase-like enzyme